jgi:addiction module RelE/StbE family toxin
MVRIEWTLQAVDDLKNIYDYISRDSIYYAKIQIRIIRNKTKQLKSNYLIGRVVPEIVDTNVRELIVGHYRIIYEVIDKQRVHILTVFHSARLLNKEKISK